MDPGWRFALGDPAGAEQAGPSTTTSGAGWTCRTTGASRGPPVRTPRPAGAGLLPYRHRLVPQSVPPARRRARPRGVARARRRLHEQRRLDQRVPPGQAAVRPISVLPTTSHHTWCLASMSWPCAWTTHSSPTRAGTRAAASTALWPDHRGFAPRGPLGHLRDDAARGLRLRRRRGHDPGGETTTLRSAGVCSAPSCSTARVTRSLARRRPFAGLRAEARDRAADTARRAAALVRGDAEPLCDPFGGAGWPALR